MTPEPGRLEVGQRVGSYTVAAPLGAGGMGEVWRARDAALGRDVAIKVLPSTSSHDPERLRRFEQEARAAGQLNHPNVLTIYAVGSAEGSPYLVTELLEGETLRERLLSGALPVRKAIDYAIQIAHGLAAAHDKGIVHRDLKPTNLFVTHDGRVKILDFGLAKLTLPTEDVETREGTASGAILGTVGYMSPEQVKGQPADHRSDLFALGLILYEMLSGRRAFSGDSAVETMNAILKTDPPALPDAPAALERIVQHCLERSPGERFQSAHDLAFDLEAARAPSTERPQTPLRPGRWRRAAAVAGILATATLGWFAWRQSVAPALSFNERDVVLVGAVENATDDPVLEGTLTMALRIALEQSRYVTLLPPTRVRDALQRMRRSPDEKLTEELAREICVREGVRALLAGAVASTGGEFVLTVRIVDPSSGASVRTASARAASKERILSAVDELASTLRLDLGESLSSIAETSRPLADATTSSIEALRAYTEGVQLNARGRRSEAEALFRRAIELDPDFARAYAALASTYRGFGLVRNTPLAEQYFQEALKRLDRVTERERLEIQALYHGSMGRNERAADFYRVLVERFPANDEYHFYLARQYESLARFEDAIREYKEVSRLNPGSSQALVRLAACYNSIDDPESARVHYERAIALEPSWETDDVQNHQFGWTLLETGREDAARAMFAKMIATGPRKRVWGLRSLGLLALYHGQLSEARKRLGEARHLNETASVFLSAARDQLYLAEASLLLGLADDGVRELDRGAALVKHMNPPAAFIILQYAALHARRGRISQSSSLLELGRRNAQTDDATDRTYLDRAEGELLTARGLRDQGLDLLRRADASTPYTGQPRHALAHALLAAGRRDEARRAYESIVAAFPQAWEGPVGWAVAHLALGQIYEDAGEIDRARTTYAKLAQVWQQADLDLPAVMKLREAQKRVGS